MGFQIHNRQTRIDWVITLDRPDEIEKSQRKIDQEYAEIIAWVETCIPQSLLVWHVGPMRGLSHLSHTAVTRLVMFHDDNDALAFRLRWM